MNRLQSDIENFESRSSDRNSLEAFDREHYWHAFTQMAEYEPLIFEKGNGAWLETSDGRRLLDAVSSLWCNVHGHRCPEIDDAIRAQLEKVAHVTSLGASCPVSIELAKKLVDVSPAPLQHVFFGSDGSSAVEVALKMAFQYWRQCDNPEPQRDLFLAVGNAYHGDTLGSVSVGGVSRFHQMFAPLLFDVLQGPCPDSYRLPAGASSTEDALEHYLAEYRSLFEQHGDRIAAVVVEPLVQGAAGMVVHPQGFLSGIRDMATEYGVLLIADEVAVGIGRTGTLWACEQEDVSPDFLCSGKGLSGGYLPVAATLTTNRVWEAFLGEYSESRSFFHGHTFGGNPLGCAAALANLQLFDDGSVLKRVNQLAGILGERLSPLRDHRLVGDVRMRGLIGGVELVRDKASKSPFPWSARMGYRVCERAMASNVWLRPIGNTVVVMPPYCVTTDEIQLIVDAINDGIEQLD
ncbi:MAG: adenosylmethionine--8-amino-7-oxononanoate transaminase [Aureliella sp.]